MEGRSRRARVARAAAGLGAPPYCMKSTLTCCEQVRLSHTVGLASKVWPGLQAPPPPRDKVSCRGCKLHSCVSGLGLGDGGRQGLVDV